MKRFASSFTRRITPRKIMFCKYTAMFCGWMFLLLPVGVYVLFLSIKWNASKKNIFLVLLLLSAGGWLLINAYFNLRFNYIMEAIAPYDSLDKMPPEILALYHICPNGAALIFALLFGWLYLPLIALISCPFVLLFRLLIIKYQRRKSALHPDAIV